MKPDRANVSREWLWVYARGLALLVVAFVLFIIAGGAGGTSADPIEWTDFMEAVSISDDARALSIGRVLFSALKQKYSRDAGFTALESRLNAAEFLAQKMQQQLRRATDARISAMAGDAADARDDSPMSGAMPAAPAKRFYETSLTVFSNPVHIVGLSDEEKMFLTRYYDLRLRSLTAAVAKAGQGLAITDPDFKGTHDYALVLPLLHASSTQPFNIHVLPSWMQRPEQLDVLSDSCLLHFELPFQAMAAARSSAEMRKVEFSEPEYYRSAAKRCGGGRARVAVECLRKAMEYVPTDQTDTTVALRFDVVQVWLEAENYPLAAGQARSLFETYPNHADTGRAIWLYYYALSRSNNTDEILAGIDNALADDRCRPYELRLMYIKWWALRCQRDQSARVAALEYELLKHHGDNPMVAPILLSRAIDLLASQDYDGAYEILQQLMHKFPSTQAAVQAQRMLERLQATRESK